jgi:hypothetical protein
MSNYNIIIKLGLIEDSELKAKVLSWLTTPETVSKYQVEIKMNGLARRTTVLMLGDLTLYRALNKRLPSVTYQIGLIRK